MRKPHKRELVVFLVILAVAAFFRLYQLDQFPPGLYPDEAMNGNNALQALSENNFKVFYPENNGREGLFMNIQAASVAAFGNTPFALRLVSAIFGILAVAGLYLLVKELHGWQMASLASFLMAVSFWHVNFSRIGFRAIMLPFVLVFGFYFLWRALKHSSRFNFMMAGIFGGLGFYTYISYRVVPVLVILVFINYWWYLKKDFAGSEYEHAKTKLLQGFVIAVLAMFIVSLPIGIHFWLNVDDFIGRQSGISVFTAADPIKAAVESTVKTLGMFNFMGDWNQRHNIGGAPMLHWVMGVFFAIGFIKELIHWLKRKHGHFSTLHTLLFAWFFLLLTPGFLSLEAPHALRAIGVIPVVMIFTAQGLWWFFDKLSDWYKAHDPRYAGGFGPLRPSDSVANGASPHFQQERQMAGPVALVLVIFLGTIGFMEYWRYFKVWGPDFHTAGAFNQNYVDRAEELNNMPIEIIKYVLVNTSGTLVNGIPMPSQTVMFLTDTYTQEKQQQKNLFYLTSEQFQKGEYDRRGVIIPLER